MDLVICTDQQGFLKSEIVKPQQFCLVHLLLTTYFLFAPCCMLTLRDLRAIKNHQKYKIYSTSGKKYTGYSHILHYFLGFEPLNTFAPLSRGGSPVCCVWMLPFLGLVPAAVMFAPDLTKGWKVGMRWCLPLPIRSARPMVFKASRNSGQLVASW